MKLIDYPTLLIAATLLFGLTVYSLGRFQVTIWTEPELSELSLPQPVATLPTLTQPEIRLQPAAQPAAPRPSASVQPNLVKPTEEVVVAQRPTDKRTFGAGQLRVSNRSHYPIRVALLARQARTQPTKTAYSEPAHWDFAPEEGSARGLILSLPEGSFKLKQGDVLVAFAQDGSRRYWGPFVVGETRLPVWNSKATEWQLVLQP